MASGNPHTPDGKLQCHQKYVAAQGNVVLRALPKEAQAQLIRHCEIALIENNGKPQDYRYFVVASETLFVVERTGSPPRVQAIPFSIIEEIEQEKSGADYLADQNIQAHSRRTCIAYGREAPNLQHQEELRHLAYRSEQGAQSGPQKLSPNNQRRRSSFFSGRYSSNSDSPTGGPRRPMESQAGQGPYGSEYLAFVTMEKQSKLYFHLWHAWIGFHMRQAAVQRLDLYSSPSPLSPGHVLGKPSRTSKEGQASARELFRELQTCILEEASDWDDGPMLALEELAVAGETSALMKRLFLESDVLFKFLVVCFSRWVKQATAKLSVKPPQASPNYSRSGSRQWPVSSPANAFNPSDNPSPRSSFPAIHGSDEIRGYEVTTTSNQDRTRESGFSTGRNLRVDVGARGTPDLRDSKQRTGAAGNEEIAVLRWEWLLRRLAQVRAGLNVLRIMDCVQRMLSNSEGIPSRLNLLNFASPHSLDSFLLDAFLLERLDQSTAPFPTQNGARQQAVMRSALQEETALDLATALLFEADSLGQQAFLEGTAQEPDYVLWALRKAPDKALRKRLSALFRRLIALLLAPQPTLDGLRVFKLAHVVTLLLPGVPGGAAHVREEFEEEIRYVLQSPDLQLKLQKQGDFFVQRSRPLVANIVQRCSADVNSSPQGKSHRRNGSLI